MLHAADLAANLPTESRCMCMLEPALEWSKQDHLLAAIANRLSILVWMQSKDGSKGRNKPKMIEPPKQRQQIRAQKEEQLSADDYKTQLQKARAAINKS